MLTVAAISAIAAGVGLATAIGGFFSNRAAAKEAKKAQEAYERKETARIEGEKKEARDMYNRDYYSNPLESAESKAAMTSAQEQIKEANDQADSAAAITGASDESKIAQRARGTKAYAGLTRDLAAQGTANKQAATNQYRTDARYMSGQSAQIAANANAYRQQTAMQQMQSANNLMSAGIGLMGTGAQMYGGMKKGTI